MKRLLLVVILVILFFTPVFTLTALTTNDDDTTGWFGLDTAGVNDAPIFLDYYTTIEAVSPLEGIIVTCSLIDVDNTTDELTVYVFYSRDAFSSENLSKTMVIDVETYSSYNYTAEIPGQIAGTYLHYYYAVTDGSNIVTAPAIIPPYLDLQWSYQAITITRTVVHYPDVEYAPEEFIIDYSIIILCFLSIVPFYIIGFKKHGAK